MWNYLMRFDKAIVLLILASILVTGVRAEDSPGVTFDFSDIEIRSFIKIVSELTGRNYVVDPAVTGKITVSSPHSIPKEAVPSVFQAVLDTYGFVAVSEGEIVKIVPATRAKQEGASPSIETPIEDNAMETRIMTPKSLNVSELQNMLSPLLSRAGHMAVHATSNTLILTDLRNNIERLTNIVNSLDKAGPDFSMDIIKLEHAEADNLADALNGLFTSKSINPETKPVIVAETHSNSLLLYAPKSLISEIAKLTAMLDQPLPEARSRFRVFHLKNADAQQMATVLNAQLNQILKTQEGGDPKSGKDKDRFSSSGILIGADPATNALIVAAPPKDLELIEEVVSSLDIERKQILVEALIMEISSGRTKELGIEWRLTDELSAGEWRGFGGTNLPLEGTTGDLQNAQKNPFNTPAGLVLGLVKGTVTFGGVEFANIASLARAMENKSGVNVLSTPHLLTLDNEEAEIIVGEERPFLKSSQTTDTGAVVRTYEFKDVGLTMRLTPRISEDGQITMKLFQEVKNFVAESDVGAITSTKREAKTTIRIADGQMTAIGGLIKEDSINNRSQVPCLGELPLIKYLFRSDKHANSKTNLVILITPHIIKNQGDLRELSDQLRKKVEE
jgi:general secretion pathway protein D